MVDPYQLHSFGRRSLNSESDFEPYLLFTIQEYTRRSSIPAVRIIRIKSIMQNHNILITNDDGIESPGLRAAVEAVLKIGTVTVVAPSYQQTGTGRGLTGDKQSSLKPIEYQVDGTKIRAYHCE